MSRIVFAFALAAIAAAALVAWQRSPASVHDGELTYERLMRDYPIARRYTVFTEQLSPATKAKMMGIHYERCLEALGPTLTAEQRGIVEEARAALSPRAYETPPEPEANAQVEAIERRAQAAFPSELGVQIFTLWSECKRP